ncbi:hypothetical protein HK105_204921 [Polyrhizophydium stewartii]|uniref:G-patch domain-containing protein n=1 Tax=Polyrhizophydium stewartii TaxID=2732419 RepID=A0ABR4N7P0_9FUNG|nr:hypothetical protein HK105_004211 [Polyrhizophydium stewartii]
MSAHEASAQLALVDEALAALREAGADEAEQAQLAAARAELALLVDMLREVDGGTTLLDPADELGGDAAWQHALHRPSEQAQGYQTEMYDVETQEAWPEPDPSEERSVESVGGFQVALQLEVVAVMTLSEPDGQQSESAEALPGSPTAGADSSGQADSAGDAGSPAPSESSWDLGMNSDSDSEPDASAFESRPTPTATGFAGWEAHTRGVGSRLLAKMGYQPGAGLGVDGAGIVEPIEVVVLPPGRGLGHADAERPVRSRRRRRGGGSGSQAAGGTGKAAPSVFDFLNTAISDSPRHESGSGDKASPAPSAKRHKPSHAAAVRADHDMERLRAELHRARAGLARNLNDPRLSAVYRGRIAACEQQMHTIAAQDAHNTRALERERMRKSMHKF